MIHRPKVIEEEGKVPAYIVTFSDMVTLLLTFFVMLLSLATMQDPELFYVGRGSFVQSVRELGLGVLFGRKPRPYLGNTKWRYFIDKPDKSFDNRTIDSDEEEIRRVFQEISQSMKTMPSQIIAKRTNFSVTNVRFSPGKAALNGASKQFLTKFCFDLQQAPGSEAISLYVLGLAANEPTEKEQWILSARRAQAVADFLKDNLPSEDETDKRPLLRLGTPRRWPIYSWGAGPGGDWVAQGSPIWKQSHILIAVLRASD